MDEKLDLTTLFGVPITISSQDKILEFVGRYLRNPRKKLFVVTPNPEIIMRAQAQPEFKAILEKADVSLPDGVGIIWASKLLNKGIKARITGADFIGTLCKEFVKSNVSIGLLGGKRGVAEKAAQCLREKYPGVNIVFAKDEWPMLELVNVKLQNKAERYHKYSEASASTFPPVDIMFVAFGFPKQEKWIYENLPYLPVKMAMGVGGAFDYLSGEVPRAPQLMRSLGFEWLYRLMVQPWRWRRQLSLISFVFLVLKEKIFTK